MTRCLAIDAATMCGYAVSDSEFSGVKDLKPTANQRPGARYQKLRTLLDHALAQFPDLDLVAYEEPIPHHSSMSAAELAWGYVSVIKLWCADAGVAVRGVHISSWKKHVTGNGTASKDMVIAAVRSLGFDPVDDNHADAVGVMLFATNCGGFRAKLL